MSSQTTKRHGDNQMSDANWRVDILLLEVTFLSLTSVSSVVVVETCNVAFIN